MIIHVEKTLTLQNDRLRSLITTQFCKTNNDEFPLCISITRTNQWDPTGHDIVNNYTKEELEQIIDFLTNIKG